MGNPADYYYKCASKNKGRKKWDDFNTYLLPEIFPAVVRDDWLVSVCKRVGWRQSLCGFRATYSSLPLQQDKGSLGSTVIKSPLLAKHMQRFYHRCIFRTRGAFLVNVLWSLCKNMCCYNSLLNSVWLLTVQPHTRVNATTTFFYSRFFWFLV